MTCFFGSQYVVHVKNIVTVLVVIAVILDSFTWLRQDSARISRSLVFKVRVADAICGG